MSIHSEMQDLTCPLCHGAVAAGSSGCRHCHLPMADVRRHAGERSGRSLGRAVGIRLTGAVLYTAAVGWAWLQFPTAFPFVVPGAVLGGGVLHVWKGRPWLGLLVFVAVVVVVPALLWPSMTTGLFAELTDGR